MNKCLHHLLWAEIAIDPIYHLEGLSLTLVVHDEIPEHASTEIDEKLRFSLLRAYTLLKVMLQRLQPTLTFLVADDGLNVINNA